MSTIGRRRLLGTLVASLPAAGVAPACSARREESRAPSGASSETTAPSPTPERRPGWQPSLFSVQQALTVEDVAEQLLPETDTPGARRAGVAEFIESLVRDVFEESERRAFLAGIAALNAATSQAQGRVFPACTPEEQRSQLERLAAATLAELEGKGGDPDAEATDPAARFWLSMRSLTIEGFAQSRLGATLVLAYDPVPGEYRGCVPFESVGKTWAL